LPTHGEGRHRPARSRCRRGSTGRVRVSVHHTRGDRGQPRPGLSSSRCGEEQSLPPWVQRSAANSLASEPPIPAEALDCATPRGMMGPASETRGHAMTDEAAFLRSILDDPDDEANRLVYADWLEERGDPRAELVRLQLETDRQAREYPGLDDWH